MKQRHCVDCGAELPSKPGRPALRCPACWSMPKACAVEGCVGQTRDGHRRFCVMHEKRLRKTGDVGPAIALRSYGTSDGRRPRDGQRGRCKVPGCTEPHRLRGYCQMHEKRVRSTGDPGEARRRIARKNEGAWFLDRHGYRVRLRDGRRELEHRVVMEQVIGRPLERWENVHHRNGVRHDNRPANLELWIKPQPSGQRPRDIAEWLVAHYRAEVEAALRGT